MILRLWNRIREPRVEKVVAFVVYVGVAVLTAVGLLRAPFFFSHSLEGNLMTSWLVLWLVSGLIGAATVFTGWWAFERVGLALGLLGAAIYSALGLVLYLSTGKSGLASLTVLWLAAGFYALRLVRVWGRDFEPRD